MIEFMPWYQPGTQLMRCLSCGSLVASGDTEIHAEWHERLEPTPKYRLVSCEDFGCTNPLCRMAHYFAGSYL